MGSRVRLAKKRIEPRGLMGERRRDANREWRRNGRGERRDGGGGGEGGNVGRQGSGVLRKGVIIVRGREGWEVKGDCGIVSLRK